MPDWIKKNVLITVRTYPMPARQGVEVSCTAGISEGQWIRLFPIPYRYLSFDKRFRKYQWIEVNIRKSSDPRPESYKLDIDSIKILSEPIPTTNNWQSRKDIVLPLKSHCLCCLQKQQQNVGFPTFGLFKPKTISGFQIEKDDANWTTEQLAKLTQMNFFDMQPIHKLEKIPYRFSYKFMCDEPNCPGHELMCTDWEIMESYRKWKEKYQRDWEKYFRDKYETQMILANDTFFYVGTLREHPHIWIIVGLFYPRLES